MIDQIASDSMDNATIHSPRLATLEQARAILASVTG